MKKKGEFLTDFMGGNRARARVLRIMVLDQESGHTSKELAGRAIISESAVKKELKVLEKWGVVKKGKPLSITLTNGTARKVVGKSKIDTWGIDSNFSDLRALTAFIREISPVNYDNVVAAIKSCGRISTVVLTGAFMGDPTRPADIIIAADSYNERRLEQAIRSLEPLFGREIRYAAFSTPEFRYRLTIQDRLLRDTLDFPHLVLLDRPGLL